MAVAGAEEGEGEEEEKGATMPPPRPSLPLFWTGKALLLLLLLLILLFCPAPASAPLYHSCLRSVRYIGMLSPFLPFPSHFWLTENEEKVRPPHTSLAAPVHPFSPSSLPWHHLVITVVGRRRHSSVMGPRNFDRRRPPEVSRVDNCSLSLGGASFFQCQ